MEPATAGSILSNVLVFMIFSPVHFRTF